MQTSNGTNAIIFSGGDALTENKVRNSAALADENLLTVLEGPVDGDDDLEEPDIAGTKRHRCILDISEVVPVLTPADDPSFETQANELSFFLKHTEDDLSTLLSSWQELSCAISTFLSYFMIRKTVASGEGLRTAAKALHNLVQHCQRTHAIPEPPHKRTPTASTTNENADSCRLLLAYTAFLAEFPYEVELELQKLWDTCYWEKKEKAYPHLKESDFELEPGDTYYNAEDGSPVVLKDSDMIMTHADIKKRGRISMYLALARVTGEVLNDQGYGGSTRHFMVRGYKVRIFCGANPQEDGPWMLDDYRDSERRYEKILTHSYGMDRIEITRVTKTGWWMEPEGSGKWRMNPEESGSGVFVPLTAKVAKMGVRGTVFSGMRLALAGGIWRPLPADSSCGICYNVYPPGFSEYSAPKDRGICNGTAIRLYW